MTASDFVQRWHHRAIDSTDPFDCFFSAWIALVIAARGNLSAQQIALPDTDRKALNIQYLESRSDSLLDVFQKLPDQLNWLAQRKGTRPTPRGQVLQSHLVAMQDATSLITPLIRPH